MSYVITIKGLAEVQRKLGANFKPAINSALQAVGEEVKTEMAQAPGSVKLPLQFASPKQRWWFLLSYLPGRKAAGLGRYKRESDPSSQTLLKSWAVKVSGGRAIVGTRASYARYVQDAKHQQPFHKNTGWITDKEALQNVIRGGIIKKIVVDAIMRLFR